MTFFNQGGESFNIDGPAKRDKQAKYRRRGSERQPARQQQAASQVRQIEPGVGGEGQTATDGQHHQQQAQAARCPQEADTTGGFGQFLPQSRGQGGAGSQGRSPVEKSQRGGGGDRWQHSA